MLFSLVERLRGWLTPFPFWVKALGPKGEYVARRHYRRKGYHCVARNWRHGHGEIDAIMANSREVVFLEVKTRRPREGQRIHELLSQQQEQRLKELAKVFLSQWPDLEIPWSFRLVWVALPVKGRCRIQEAVL